MVKVKAKRLNVLPLTYYNPERPASYAGARNLIETFRNKLPRRKVIDWLESQDAYTKHRPVRRRYFRRTYNVRNVDSVWEGDIIDFRNLRRFNRGIPYLLVVIDCLSKYMWIEPLRDKSSASTAEALEKILLRDRRSPAFFQTDKGREFTGQQVQDLLRKHDIRFRTSRSPDVKASVVERAIRSAKERIWRYLTHRDTKNYIDVLQKIVYAYNHTRHSGTRLIPANVTESDADEAYENLQRRYANRRRKTPARNKYRVGDYVRVSKAKAVFGKGYKPGFTDELFQIARANHSREPIVYILRDLQGQEIDGIFYSAELSRVNSESVKRVDKVLETRGRGAKKEYHVTWVNRLDNNSSWINSNEYRKYSR